MIKRGFIVTEITYAQTAPDALLESDEVLPVKLTGAFRKMFNDRSDKAVYHPLQLSGYGRFSKKAM